MEVRVQDYLDDKLQSAADLESLDSLLKSVKAQQDLLKQQLDDARREHDEANDAAEAHAGAVRQKATGFQKAQHDIDRRLLIVTQSETSDEAAAKFEGSMARLRKLDIAAGYVELLKEVDALRIECTSRLGNDDDAALVAYKRLQQLLTSLRSLQDSAEGAAPHLLDHIAAGVKELRQTIQRGFAENLEKTMLKMNWPKSTDRVPLALEKEWTVNVGRLLDLQIQELENREHDPECNTMHDPPVLLPLEVLVQPLEQRFTYHFSGNKQTNRLDKPEYFLDHVTDLIANHSDFVQDNIQPILLQQFRRSDLGFTPAYIDALSSFITALMPMVKHKLYTFASQVANQPNLLSHLVQEVIRFDMTLQDAYEYTPSSPAVPWRGMSYFLLENCGYFQQWLGAERDFAISRYQAIVNSQDAGEIDYDAVSADATKPTKAAIRVNDLLEEITAKYRNLTSFSQKIRFLIDIQIEIFDQYYKRLSSGLEAYLTLTSTVGRVTSISKEDSAKVQGVRGLDRLCRIFGSADYLQRAMRDWSDDVFFLELWAELAYRSKNRDQTSRNFSWQEVQQKTSTTLGTENDGGLEGALFDETETSYSRLRDRSENVLIETLTYSVRQTLRPYAAIVTWASLSSSSAGSATSSELDPLLNFVQEHFAFLHKALGKAPMRRIGRQTCHVIQSYVWDNILQSRTSFSTAGATQLTTDMRTVCASLDRYMGRGQAQIGMRRLLEGATLLSLPVRGEIDRVKASPSGGDKDEDAAAWGDTNGDRKSDDGRQMSLFQAERLVFMDNESARHALEKLGLETLTEADARTVLGKRVEISS
ncbi:hypothetical protein DOTSEDRAFT_91382 [Dothistroma septosporum NZE10]|uniref:RINT-1 family protein n=1 Tax=Dothistroma septosporum (strain NZE10 / CBS 128990) TaxID=675120 RepID=N1PET5_DOTSN|nr:hypothetical protein DOTSEDRAFT_91382 [Dothistroma septosporum NZE10]